MFCISWGFFYMYRCVGIYVYIISSVCVLATTGIQLPLQLAYIPEFQCKLMAGCSCSVSKIQPYGYQDCLSTKYMLSSACQPNSTLSNSVGN